jgi:hypothetical protein
MATPETALWLFQGWPACRRLTTPLDTPDNTSLETGEFLDQADPQWAELSSK